MDNLYFSSQTSSKISSPFQKQHEYEDEPYEMMNEPYELDKISPKEPAIQPNIESSISIKEPISPSFNNQISHNQQVIQKSKPISNSSNMKDNSTYPIQLANKVRKQAEQLMALEGYKMLCEQRISELCPGHPLPVQITHLGTIMGETLELTKKLQESQNLMKAKDEEIKKLMTELGSMQKSMDRKQSTQINNSDETNSNYNVLFVKYTALLNEKNQLEESLRNETINSEEQRAYIEVLKEMLEEKFDKYGIARFNGRGDASRAELFIELKTLQEKVLKYTEENNEKEIELKKLKDENNKINQKNQELLNTNLQLSELNIKLSQGVKAMENEILRIEEEKSNLLEYIDKNSEEYEKMATENAKLSENNEKFQEDLNIMTDKYNKSNEELMKLNSKLKEIQKELEDLNLKNNEYQKDNTKLKEENKRMKEDIMSLKQSYNKLEDMNNKLTEVGKLNKEEILKYQNELNQITNKLNEYKETFRAKELDYQNNFTLTSLTHREDINRLESRINQLQDREYALSNDIKRYINDNKDLENERQKLLKIINETNDIKNENLELKERLMVYETERGLYEENINKINKEYKEYKYNIDDNEYKAGILQQKILSLENELQNYENILRDNKYRYDKERNTMVEEIKHYIEENKNLRNEYHYLKENFNRTIQSLNLKEDEIIQFKDHLDKKSSLLQVLEDENRLLKQKYDEFNLIKEQIEKFKIESLKIFLKESDDDNTNASEQRGAIKNVHLLQQQNQSINHSINNTMLNIEKDLFRTLTNLKELQKEKIDLHLENQKLKKKLETLDDELKGLTDFLGEKENKFENTLQEKQNLNKQLLELNKDFDELSIENKRLYDERNQLAKTLEKFKKDFYGLCNPFNSSMKLYIEKITQICNNTVNQTHNQTPLSQKFTQFIDKYNMPELETDMDNGVSNQGAIIKHATSMLAEELENLLRKCIDLRQDLGISNQRVYTLERKCMNLSLNMNNEDIPIKQQQQQDKGGKGIDTDNVESKKEFQNTRLELDRFNQDQYKVPSDNKQFQQQTHSKSYMNDLTNIEERLTLISKEKKNLEEILHKIIDLIPSPDIKKLIKNIEQVQTDIDISERERYNLENKLNELETDFKLALKKGTINQARSIDMRVEIENKRNDLTNLSGQIAIFKKRKYNLFEEIKNYEIIEKRRFYTTIELEKNLIQVRNELDEVKTQNKIVESDYKKGLKNTEYNSVRYHDRIDSVDLKNAENNNPNYSEKNGDKDDKKKYILDQDYLAYTFTRATKEVNDNNFNDLFKHKSISHNHNKIDGSGSMTERQSFSSNAAENENKRLSSMSKDIYPTTTGKKISLKDRLDQAKNMISSMKKNYDDEINKDRQLFYSINEHDDDSDNVYLQQ